MYRAKTGFQNTETVTVAPLVDSKGVRDERRAFANFMYRHRNDRCTDRNNVIGVVELWDMYKDDIRRDYPCISVLLEIVLVLPMSNALVERTFSRMNLIHTAVRNRLGALTVDSLMMVSMEGPPLSELRVGCKFLRDVSVAWNDLPAAEKWHSGASAHAEDF